MEYSLAVQRLADANLLSAFVVFSKEMAAQGRAFGGIRATFENIEFGISSPPGQLGTRNNGFLVVIGACSAQCRPTPSLAHKPRPAKGEASNIGTTTHTTRCRRNTALRGSVGGIDTTTPADRISAERRLLPTKCWQHVG